MNGAYKGANDNEAEKFLAKIPDLQVSWHTLSDEELFEDGKRNWAKTNGKEFSVCRLIHLNTIANFKNFRGKIRKWKKNNK